MTLPNNVPIPFPIEWVEIPHTNYRTRTAGQMPDCVVIHIADGSKDSVIATFKDPSTQKSSHFLITKNGGVVQFVSTGYASYCTGNIDNPVNELALARTANPNDWTLSIEHEGFSSEDITEYQYQTTARLVKFLHDKWAVPLDRTHVFGHREVFSQKICPGKINVERIVQMARKL